MTLPTLCIFVAIVFERFAWYLFLGELEEWRGPQAVGDLMAMAYLLPLFGGWLAGRLSLRSVCLAGACTLVGAYVAAAMGWPRCALGLAAMGCGLFKPTLATMLGAQFATSAAQTKAFSRFHAAVNVGSLPSTLVGAWLRLHYGLPVAFAAAGGATLLAVAALLVGWRSLRPSEDDAIARALSAAPSDATEAVAAEAPARWGRVAVLCIGAALFFVALQQQQTTMLVWAKEKLHMDAPETVSSLNPLCVLLLALTPLSGWASSLRLRLVLAQVAIGAAFALLLVGEHSASPLWLCGWYVLATVGEVLLYPLGMGLVVSLVPRRHAALAMSLWLLSLSLGSKGAGLLAAAGVDVAVRASLAICAAGAIWFAVALSEWTALTHRLRLTFRIPSVKYVAEG